MATREPMTMSASAEPEPIRPRRYTLRPAQRLRRQRAFDAVYKGGAVKRAGPLRLHGLPNEVGHARLGLSVPRRVGNAVRRNRVKRLLRESFRLLQHELPGAYDLVIVVMRHEPMKLADYQRLLADAARRIDAHFRKRAAGAEVAGRSSQVRGHKSEVKGQDQGLE